MAVEENFLIKTKRLCLRPLRLDDWPSVQRIGGHPLVAPMLASTAHPGLRRRCRLGSPRGSIAENRDFVRRLCCLSVL